MMTACSSRRAATRPHGEAGCSHLRRYGERKASTDPISSALPGFPDLLRSAGLPEGAVVEFCSSGGLGKLTLACEVARCSADVGTRVLYIDADGGLNRSFLESMGMRSLVFHNENNPNGPIRICRKGILEDVDAFITAFLEHYSDTRLVVIDSFSMLQPRILIEEGTGRIEESKTRQLRGQFLRKQLLLNQKRNRPVRFILNSHVKEGLQRPGAKTGEWNKRSLGGVVQDHMVVRIIVKDARKDILRFEQTPTGRQEVLCGRRLSLKTVGRSPWIRPGAEIELAIEFGRGIEPVITVIDAL